MMKRWRYTALALVANLCAVSGALAATKVELAGGKSESATNAQGYYETRYTAPDGTTVTPNTRTWPNTLGYYPITALFDGKLGDGPPSPGENHGHYWLSDNVTGFGSAANPHTLIFEFPAERKIESIRIYPRGQKREYKRASDYQVHVTTNGVTWGTVSNGWVSVEADEMGGFHDHPIGITVKAIRISLKSTPLVDAASLAEVELYAP